MPKKQVIRKKQQSARPRKPNVWNIFVHVESLNSAEKIKMSAIKAKWATLTKEEKAAYSSYKIEPRKKKSRTKRVKKETVIDEV